MEVTSDLKELTMQYDQLGLLAHITRKVSADSELMAVMKKTKGKLPYQGLIGTVFMGFPRRLWC